MTIYNKISHLQQNKCTPSIKLCSHGNEIINLIVRGAAPGTGEEGQIVLSIVTFHHYAKNVKGHYRTIPDKIYGTLLPM